MRNVIVLGAAALALALGGCSYIYGHGDASRGQSHQGASPMAAGSAASSHKKTAADAAEVKQAQQELQSQGLYHGKIDGIAGPETQQALKDFQEKSGLQQTGSLDEHTRTALNDGAASSGSSTPPGGTSSSEGAPAGASPGDSDTTAPSGAGTSK